MDWESYAEKHYQIEDITYMSPLFMRALHVARTNADGPISILDAGAGNGVVFNILLKLDLVGPKDNLVAVDIARKNIESIQARVPDIQGIVSSIEKMPIDYNFDLCVCNSVIEHIKDQDKALKRLRTAISPNGLLYITTVARLRGGWYFYRNAIGQWVLDPTHVREYQGPDEFAYVLKEAGLTVIEHSVKPTSYPLPALCARLLGKNERLNLGPLSDIRIPIPKYRRLLFLCRVADPLEAT